MNVTLNETERAIYDECKKVAIAHGDNGSEFIIDDLKVDVSIHQLKGYLSQLTQKGLLEKIEDSYFDFIVTELYKD